MADLGVIGNWIKAKFASDSIRSVPNVSQGEHIKSLYSNTLPIWLPVSGIDLFNIDQSGSLPGQVNGTSDVKKGTRLYLFSSNGYLIDSKLANTNGSFNFTGLDKTSTDYYVVAVAPGTYNAQIFSKLPPN